MQMHSMGQEVMTSGDARGAILSRHDQLRGVAEQTLRLTGDAAAGDESLRDQARALCAAVREHIEFEEDIMAIALADVVGLEGELLVELDADHQRQRANAASTLAALEPDNLPTARVVACVRALAESVLLDLTGEERYFLSADVDELTDDSLGG
jgi:hypothetical protein